MCSLEAVDQSDTTEATFDPVSLDRYAGSLEPRQTATVQYEMRAASYGLLQETFVVHNDSNPLQEARDLNFSLFVDPGWLSVLPTDAGALVEPEASQTQLDNIPVLVHEMKVTVPPLRYQTPPTLCLMNTSNRVLVLQPSSKLDVTVSEALDDLAHPWAREVDSCGPAFTLRPLDCITLYIWTNTIPQPTAQQVCGRGCSGRLTPPPHLKHGTRHERHDPNSVRGAE